MTTNIDPTDSDLFSDTALLRSFFDDAVKDFKGSVKLVDNFLYLSNQAYIDKRKREGRYYYGMAMTIKAEAISKLHHAISRCPYLPFAKYTAPDGVKVSSAEHSFMAVLHKYLPNG